MHTPTIKETKDSKLKCHRANSLCSDSGSVICNSSVGAKVGIFVGREVGDIVGTVVGKLVGAGVGKVFFPHADSNISLSFCDASR